MLRHIVPHLIGPDFPSIKTRQLVRGFQIGVFRSIRVDHTDFSKWLLKLNHSPEKWETVASGQWIQKEVWNRLVTRTMWEQSHTTPVTTTWTFDFLSREGEGRKAMGDWLHDKMIPWKSRRRLLQTNSGILIDRCVYWHSNI